MVNTVILTFGLVVELTNGRFQFLEVEESIITHFGSERLRHITNRSKGTWMKEMF